MPIIIKITRFASDDWGPIGNGTKFNHWFEWPKIIGNEKKKKTIEENIIFQRNKQKTQRENVEEKSLEETLDLALEGRAFFDLSCAPFGSNLGKN